MEPIDINLSKIKEQLNASGQKTGRSLSVINLNPKKYKKEDLTKLNTLTQTIKVIQTNIFDKNPLFNDVIFLADKTNCSQALINEYMNGAQLTRENIIEALKIADEKRNIPEGIETNINQSIEKVMENLQNLNNMTQESKPFDPKNFNKLDKQTIINILNAHRKGNIEFMNHYNMLKTKLAYRKEKMQQVNSIYKKLKRGNNIKNFVNVSKIAKNNIDLRILTKNISPKINDTDVYKIYSSRNNNAQYTQLKTQLEGKYSKNKKSVEKLDSYIKFSKQISSTSPDFEKSKSIGLIKTLIVSRINEDTRTFRITFKELIKKFRPKYNPTTKQLDGNERFKDLLDIYNILYGSIKNSKLTVSNRNKESKIYKILTIQNYIDGVSPKCKIQPAMLARLADGALYLDKGNLSQSRIKIEVEFENFFKKFKYDNNTKYNSLKEHLDKFIIFEDGDELCEYLKDIQNDITNKNANNSKITKTKKEINIIKGKIIKINRQINETKYITTLDTSIKNKQKAAIKKHEKEITEKENMMKNISKKQNVTTSIKQKLNSRIKPVFFKRLKFVHDEMRSNLI